MRGRRKDKTKANQDGGRKIDKRPRERMRERELGRERMRERGRERENERERDKREQNELTIPFLWRKKGRWSGVGAVLC